MGKVGKIKREFSSETILHQYPDLEYVIDGKTFTVAKRLPMAMINNSVKEAVLAEGSDALVNHMAELFGVEAKEIEDLNLDIRVFRQVMDAVQADISEQIETGTKDPTHAERSSQK